MKRDVAILDNGNYKTENKSEEDIRLHLCKLVTKLRKNVHRKLRRGREIMIRIRPGQTTYESVLVGYERQTS